MQRMEWRNGKLQPRNGMAFLKRILLAHVDGITPGEFVEQELRCMACPFCRDGVPLDDGGNHYVLGITMPCEAKL